jgi:hypothetical protein
MMFEFVGDGGVFTASLFLARTCLDKKEILLNVEGIDRHTPKRLC